MASVRGGRDCRHFQHAEFGGFSRPGSPTLEHLRYSREAAVAGCPRCIDETLRRIRRRRALPLSPDDLNEMQRSVNHTLDGYWQGRRQPLVDALWSITILTCPRRGV